LSVFADSSALVKRYVDEAGHELVRSISSTVVVSALARVEVPAALWRKHRIGELDAKDAAVLVQDFEYEYFGDGVTPSTLIAIDVTAGVLDTAARLAATHGLRAYDSVQLSTALAARLVLVDLTVFAAFDDSLNRAAAAEGLTLL
jgi:uncharacterized protein